MFSLVGSKLRFSVVIGFFGVLLSGCAYVSPKLVPVKDIDLELRDKIALPEGVGEISITSPNGADLIARPLDARVPWQTIEFSIADINHELTKMGEANEEDSFQCFVKLHAVELSHELMAQGMNYDTVYLEAIFDMVRQCGSKTYETQVAGSYETDKFFLTDSALSSAYSEALYRLIISLTSASD